MKKWLKKLEDIMAAAAYAQAGEFETARNTLKKNRKILLALKGEESDAHAFRYAVNSCKRNGADLEILYTFDDSQDLLKQFKSELKKKGVEYSIIKRKGLLEEAIQEYAGTKSNIVFVVVESPEEINQRSKKVNINISESWKNLKCPLVVVSKPSMA
jgi:hypothetical protein